MTGLWGKFSGVQTVTGIPSLEKYNIVDINQRQRREDVPRKKKQLNMTKYIQKYRQLCTICKKKYVQY